MAQTFRHSRKQNLTESGTVQSDEFWSWIDQMKKHETATRKNERVYLVISKLRRVAEGERKGVAGRLGSFRNSMPSSSINSASSSSFKSASLRKDPSQADRASERCYDSRDDIHDSDDSEECADVRKQLKTMLKVGADMLVSAMSREQPEVSGSASDDSTDSSRASLKRRRSSREYSGGPKPQRFTPRYPSPPGIMPARAFRNHAQLRRDSVMAQDESRDLIAPSKARPPPQSRFQGSKTAEQHWAVEVGGRYFELEVRKKAYGDGVKSFSRFTCKHRAGQTDREITEKIYVGRTHMTHSVLREIGAGIMKTQPKYTLPSDNCQHFMAVYLPRILCNRHAYFTTLPNASVEWIHKITTLPLYKVGVIPGLVTVVEHNYYRIASGVQHVLHQLKDRESVERNYKSNETSKYNFQLQSNDPAKFDNCQTLRKNPYRMIHREFEKSERKPLGDCEEIANDCWVWEANRNKRRTARLIELELVQNIEAAKGIWNSVRKQKMDFELERKIMQRMNSSKSQAGSGLVESGSD